MIEGAIDIENLDGGPDEDDVSGRRGVRSSAQPQALRNSGTRQAELVVDLQQAVESRGGTEGGTGVGRWRCLLLNAGAGAVPLGNLGVDAWGAGRLHGSRSPSV